LDPTRDDESFIGLRKRLELAPTEVELRPGDEMEGDDINRRSILFLTREGWSGLQQRRHFPQE
jgi:hypothetical protein